MIDLWFFEQSLTLEWWSVGVLGCGLKIVLYYSNTPFLQKKL